MKLEGVFGVYHLVYLIITTILTVVGVIIIKKYVKKDTTLKLILRIGGGILLAFIIANRISTVYYKIYITKVINTWWAVFPDSICSGCSLLLALSLLISPKKNNPTFYFLVYMGIAGSLLTAFYPDFLKVQAFSLTNSWTGMMHHSIMLFLLLVIITNGYFEPSLKKFYLTPLIYGCFILFGLFNISAFNIPNSMNINKPLISDLKILTSWYMVGILLSVLVFIFTLLYEKKLKFIKFNNKHKDEIKESD